MDLEGALGAAACKDIYCTPLEGLINEFDGVTLKFVILGIYESLDWGRRAFLVEQAVYFSRP